MGKVLIVEDDKYLNKLLSDRFSLEGFHVESVLDGQSGFDSISQAHTSGSPFDFLICDMLLPQVMGAELFTKLKENQLSENLKMVAISGVYKDPNQISQLINLHGLHSYWTKPFDINELLSNISGKSFSKNESVQKKGLLVQRPFEKLLLDAYNEAFTGQLQISKESAQRKIFFQNGFPVGAHSTVISESLGQSFVMMGLITPEIQIEASKKMVEEGLQLGQMLLKMEALSKNQLFEGIRRHTYRLLVNTCLWKDGEYELQALQDLPAYILPLEFNPLLIIFRSHRDIYTKEFLKDFFKAKENFHIGFSQRAFQILPMLNLDAGSKSFLESISPKESLREVLNKMPESNHEILFRVFFLLENLELIQISEGTKEAGDFKPSTDFAKDFKEEQRIPKEIAERIQSEYMDLLSKNYFEILEITPQSKTEEIEESYRTIRYRLHPDRYGSKLSGQVKRILDDMLSKIDKAYQTVSDTDLKTEYLKSIKQFKADSAQDSKKFLEAQDYFREGLKFSANHNYKTALEKFKGAAKVWPRGIEYVSYACYAEFKLAQIEKNEANEQKALKSLEDICKKNPSQDMGPVLLGHIYVSRGQIPQAREAYQMALRNNDRNEEAANALAGLAHIQIKKDRFSRTVKSTQYYLLRTIVWTAIAAGGVFLFLNLDEFLKKEEGIHLLSNDDLKDILPAKNIRQKGDTAKIVLSDGWIASAPDSILTSRCVQSLSKLKAYGILRLYLYDEKSGLKGVCRENKVIRY
ncbi:MAG: response regulator [Deltaproteobacteria bacterium]|nr:response regulator [Deltaproteobacteria bacterium]